MELEIESKQPKFYNQIIKALEKGFLSHAYLIDTTNNDIEIVRKYIFFLVKKIYEETYKNSDVTIPKEKLINLLSKNEFPDYIEINPINNLIKKEQLLFIRDEFSNKSLYNTKKVYTVFDCEKMNSSASNTILKFLEEPSDDVIAIFVTNNQYNVLDTIRSRCQIIRLQYEENDSIVFSDEILEFVNDIDNRKQKDLLLKFNYYFKLFNDKKNTIKFLQNMLKYYEIRLSQNSQNDKIQEIVFIVSIFEDALKKLRYNVNIKLWLDNLLISLMEV